MSHLTVWMVPWLESSTNVNPDSVGQPVAGVGCGGGTIQTLILAAFVFSLAYYYFRVYLPRKNGETRDRYHVKPVGLGRKFVLVILGLAALVFLAAHIFSSVQEQQHSGDAVNLQVELGTGYNPSTGRNNGGLTESAERQLQRARKAQQSNADTFRRIKIFMWQLFLGTFVLTIIAFLVFVVFRKKEQIRDIRFDCPHCSESLEAESDMAGGVLDCPTCTKEIRIPSP